MYSIVQPSQEGLIKDIREKYTLSLPIQPKFLYMKIFALMHNSVYYECHALPTDYDKIFPRRSIAVDAGI